MLNVSAYLQSLQLTYYHILPCIQSDIVTVGLAFSFCVMFIVQESLELHANSLGLHRVVLEHRWDWFKGRNRMLEVPMAVANMNLMANRAHQGALGRAPPAWRRLHPFVSIISFFPRCFQFPHPPV